MKKSVNILNKKARFTYELLDTYVAGIVLTGTEIKSIRESKASITESFCEFNLRGELFVINMTIQEYDFGNHYNHAPKAERKLLLNKKELKKLEKEVKNSGLTIIPLKFFINEYPNGEDIIDSVTYNDEELENSGGDTNGKGYYGHVWTNQ